MRETVARDPASVASPNPGYCFKLAELAAIGSTRDRGLVVLRRPPGGAS